MQLIKYSDINEREFDSYMNEWEASGEKIIPFSCSRSGMQYEEIQKKWDESTKEEIRLKGFVPATLFFLVDDSERIMGALDLRHDLNEHLFLFGGNIGYGIRPSERKKGYAKLQLQLGLKEAKKMGIEKILITCDENNLGSAKTIEACGGKLENIVTGTDNIGKKRYFVEV